MTDERTAVLDQPRPDFRHYMEGPAVEEAIEDQEAARNAKIDRRREAVRTIEAAKFKFEPQIRGAEQLVKDAMLQTQAAREVLREAEEKERNARIGHDSLCHQLDAAVAAQERVIAANRDPELASLVSRLENEMQTTKGNGLGSRRAEARYEKLKNAAEKARRLERDPGIINTVKLAIAMGEVVIAGGLS